MESQVPPLTLDELTALENIPDGRPPQKLGTVCTFLSPLVGRAGEYSSASARQIELTPLEDRAAGVAGFELPGNGLTVGLDVATGGVGELSRDC